MKIKVTKTCTIFNFLKEHYPDSPRTRIKKILKSGIVSVNDRSVTYHALVVNPDDEVEIHKKPGSVAGRVIPFPVLYDDRELIVVDKPAGISTSSIDGSRSVREVVSEFLKNLSKGKHLAYVVHRLDKEVSGVLLFAKTRKAMEVLKEKWPETEKHYFALVEGIPLKTAGTIKSWLIEDKLQKVKSVKKQPDARFAVTNYTVIRKFKDTALLDIRTDTGRKNQIRVHLSESGHPIVGDRKYGASGKFIRRVRLHAYSLSFPHPADGRVVIVKSPMPEGFLVLKEQDEKYK